MANAINTQPTVSDEESRRLLFGQTAAIVAEPEMATRY
jgi:hypothetical protein